MKNALPSDISQLLGGYSADRFLARYWHKRPLLVRRAIPGFRPLLTRAQLFALAGRDDVESRLVSRVRGRFRLEHGPFAARALRRGTAPPWTLLVQGVNLHHAGADALLQRFGFVPSARLDDLMISWATDGGGVGPHFDSYDVFLLQAHGRRRWRISTQRDRALVPGAPLRILRDFRPGEEWVLEPGDMLYLPPGCAHDGVALGECMTYSIGFRAPSAQELTRGYLEHLADHLQRPGMYADPDLRATRAPARVPERYVERAMRLIGTLRPTRESVAAFLGAYLSEPKASVFFDPPAAPLARARFARAAAARGVRLDPRTRMLHRGRALYVNGDTFADAASPALTALADARRLAPGPLPAGRDLDLLYAWYTHGWLHPGASP
ncbi:MAG: cupin domain-containing protein [Burkholderiales bacterium]|nr:cupin domain-containing protein [Burkholderiales bacterium]